MDASKPLPGLSGRLPYCPVGQGVGMRPTFYGFVYLGMTLALLLGSINHNNNLGYLLTFLLTGLLLVSARETRLAVQGLEAGPCAAEPAFAGATALARLSLRARTRPRYGLHLTLASDTPEAPVSLDLPAERPVRAELPLSVSQRGLARCDRLTVASDFPFGLLECRARLPVSCVCLVYPRPVNVPPAVAAAAASGGEDEEREQAPVAPPGQGLDFAGIRPDRPGDNPSRIHWKSLARGQGAHVMEFTEEEHGSPVFSLARLPGRDIEHKLSCLCRLVLVAAGQGRRYGLDLGLGATIGPDRGERHRARCLEALALYGIADTRETDGATTRGERA